MRKTLGWLGRLTAALTVMIVGLAVLPGSPAEAVSNVTAVWSLNGAAEYLTPTCSRAATYTYGGRALEVYNPCGTRVWLHAYDNSTGQIYAYCVNPNKAVAYGFSRSFTDLQVTTNTSDCDAGEDFRVSWVNPLLNTYPYECLMTTPGIWITHNSVAGVITLCNFRIWLHQHDDGTGASYCINPNPNKTVGFGYDPPDNKEYWQVQPSFNQAPCSAGAAPYPD